MLIKPESIKYRYVNLYSLVEEKFGIPIFQRFFAWKKDQTKQILIDIKEAINNPDKELYLLDFIYYLDEGKYMIADGQQRLVSINSLHKVINDVINERNLDIEPLELYNIEYDIVQNNKKYNDSFYNYPVAPFKSIYLHFKAFIEENIDILEQIIHVLKNKLFIYFKKCDNADDAFDIFQQINTGGKPLTKDEIIKTAIDQYAKIYDVEVNNKVKDLKQAVTSYYRYVTGNTSSSFDNIAIISFIKKEVTSTKEQFKSFAKMMDVIIELNKNPITNVVNYIQRPSINEVLNVLSMRGIDINDNIKYTSDVIVPLCLLSISISISNGLPSTIKYLMDKVIKMINDSNSVEEISIEIGKYIDEHAQGCKISFDDFQEALGNPKVNLGIKKGLLILDVILRNISGTLNIKKINLEHIYPQNPRNTWITQGWPTDKDEIKKMCNNIGNLFLLCEEVNKSISNKYISEKVDQYKKVIKKDQILRTDLNTVDFVRFENEGYQYIQERQKYIAKQIYNTFPFAKKIIFMNQQ